MSALTRSRLSRSIAWVFLALACVVPLKLHAAQALEVIYPAPESPSDHRYDYFWQVLRQALTTTESDFGPFKLHPTAIPMSDALSISALAGRTGTVNVLVRGSVRDFEKRLRPIRFPLDKGLLGYRVFLIKKQLQPKLDQVRSLNDLTHFSIGQGAKWGDIPILTHAGFTVKEGSDYDALFRMLDGGRFDLFSRGVQEIGAELAKFQPHYPDLAIEQKLLLYYPMARYFYVERSKEGEALAARLSEGLERMLKDGSFDRLFREYVAPVEQQHHLKERVVYRISNPELTTETALLSRRALWYDPAPN